MNASKTLFECFGRNESRARYVHWRTHTNTALAQHSKYNMNQTCNLPIKGELVAQVSLLVWKYTAESCTICHHVADRTSRQPKNLYETRKNLRDRENFTTKQHTASYLASIHPQRLLQKVMADPTLLSSGVTNKRSINHQIWQISTPQNLLIDDFSTTTTS